MIYNSDKLNGCDIRVREVVEYLDVVYHDVYVTRGNDDPANAPKNSSKKSQHFLGKAADIIIPDTHPYKVAARVLEKFPVRGLGVSVFSHFVHFDFRDADRLVEWTYDSQGKEIN